MELALPSFSATLEAVPPLRRRSESSLPCEDRERNRLRRLDSFCWTDTAEALLAMCWCSTLAVVSAVEVVVGVEAGEGGGGGLRLRRAFE